MQYLRITEADGSTRWAHTFEHKYSKGWPAPPTGFVYAKHLIDGQIDEVREAQVELVDVPYNSPVRKEIEAVVDADYEAALIKSKALGNAFAKGRIFYMGVADGRAFYVVTKVNAKTCDVQWRSWGGEDHYTDRILGFGGRFPRHMIEPLVGHQAALESIFGKKVEGLAD